MGERHRAAQASQSDRRDTQPWKLQERAAFCSGSFRDLEPTASCSDQTPKAQGPQADHFSQDLELLRVLRNRHQASWANVLLEETEKR